jgi:hypothetical protein
MLDWRGLVESFMQLDFVSMKITVGVFYRCGAKVWCSKFSRETLVSTKASASKPQRKGVMPHNGNRSNARSVAAQSTLMVWSE